jgi:hypothetical protein
MQAVVNGWYACTIVQKENKTCFAGHAAIGAFENFSKSTIGLYKPV